MFEREGGGFGVEFFMGVHKFRGGIRDLVSPGPSVKTMYRILSDIKKNSDEYSGDKGVYKIPQIER